MKIAGTGLIAAGMMILPTMAMSNDFSTATRVQFVMDCMAANEMNVYEGTHKCSCVVDKLAEVFTQKEFEDISVGFMYKNLPADRGATFRDDKNIQTGLKLYEKTSAEAYKACRIK
ncbi:hypothetical protein LP43_0509 [Methylophaga thiooxydans]|uniref:Uncharacterized protein n=1 Tax=Methylophaga thiooxydans TaxID=392484 RepID=A0A0A0BJB8_9GAMM|nr:hypothetical protein [Methylophaga thiooxydans]KGM08086.1 hypothetical protein LP43_0509 [Methylophaga thiooxydans]